MSPPFISPKFSKVLLSPSSGTVSFQFLIRVSFIVSTSGNLGLCLIIPGTVKMGVSCEESVVRSESREKVYLVWVE